MVWGLYSLPHLFPDKCMDMTDVANYLGKKYGGWTPVGRDLRQVGRQVDRHPGRDHRRPDELPHLVDGEGGLQGIPEGHRGLPRTRQGAEEEQHAGRLRARPRLGRRQHLAALGAVVAWRSARRQERQGRHQLAGNREGAGIRQGAVRELHSRHGVVERLVQQQDLRRRRSAPDLERHLDLCRARRRTTRRSPRT